jgi:hypothetical protein
MRATERLGRVVQTSVFSGWAGLMEELRRGSHNTEPGDRHRSAGWEWRVAVWAADREREVSCCVGEVCGLERCAEAEESRARRVRDDLCCCVRTGEERRGEAMESEERRPHQRQRGSCLS